MTKYEPFEHYEYSGTNRFFDTGRDWLIIAGAVLTLIALCGVVYWLLTKGLLV